MENTSIIDNKNQDILFTFIVSSLLENYKFLKAFFYQSFVPGITSLHQLMREWP